MTNAALPGFGDPYVQQGFSGLGDIAARKEGGPGPCGAHLCLCLWDAGTGVLYRAPLSLSWKKLWYPLQPRVLGTFPDAELHRRSFPLSLAPAPSPGFLACGELKTAEASGALLVCHGLLLQLHLWNVFLLLPRPTLWSDFMCPMAFC